MLLKYEIVCVQEVHGLEGDLATLRKDFPHHVFYGSWGATCQLGGVLIGIKADFADSHFGFYEVMVLAELSVERRRPADASKAWKLFIDIAAAIQ